VVLSLGAGLLAGSIGYLAGPVVCAAALGLSSMAMSFVGFVVAPFVRLWKSLQSQEA
jgi:hypothetical protein